MVAKDAFCNVRYTVTVLLLFYSSSPLYPPDSPPVHFNRPPGVLRRKIFKKNGFRFIKMSPFKI